jgi:hypothetical protein
VISAKVAALTEGTVKTMFVNKLKVATATLLMITVLGAGAIGLIYQTQAAEQSKDSNKEAPVAATPAEKTSPKNAKKEPDVLTPAEAIKQRDKGKVTVQFEVASVEAFLLDGAIAEGSRISRLEVRLKDGNNFSARLTGRVTYQIERLGIDPAKHFSGKVVRVTGRVQQIESARTFQIVVDDLNQFEVVR